RLEGAAANHSCPGVRDNIGSLLDLSAVFDAARARHHYDGSAADLHIADFHNGSRRLESAAGQLVRRHHAVHFFHRFHRFDYGRIEVILAADASEYSVDNTG